ncbi:MAG TPA: hypothetical protein VJL30_01075 [Patescibacteria group bacterium]|nr:MAG: hypothetical protein A2793_02745 [candidate division WWE3 bacterium RIFCSPHIGHO2_01_FULL_38_45]HLB51491.1 hypothetical protein [Patescibacteria group bacterium]
MRKGIAAPTILLVVVLFSVAGIVLFSLENNKENDVKGTSNKKTAEEKAGFVFEVNSLSTWELLEYLCTTESECKSGPDSGKRWGTVGGGQASMKSVLVPYQDEWSAYKYLKVYMKPGLSSSGVIFKVSLLNSDTGAQNAVLGDADSKYEAVLVPLGSPVSGQVKVASFNAER